MKNAHPLAAALIALAALGANSAGAVTAVLDVSGTDSFHELGKGNIVLFADVAPFTTLNYLAWDVTITSHAPSWLSEAILQISDQQVTQGLFLAVGDVDDEVTGTRHYRGAYDLAALGSSIDVGEDGAVRVEFFEAFDDEEVSPDSTWDSGTLTFSTEQLTAPFSEAGPLIPPDPVAAIPEPTSWAMMALGLSFFGVAARRRAKAAVGVRP